MKKNMTEKMTAIALFVVSLIINGVAGSTTILGGVKTNEISDMHRNLFAPAGVTFAIWGVIYLLMAVFCVRFMMQRGSLKAEFINKEVKYFTIISALNALWMLTWQFQILWLSVVIIIGMLFTLKRATSLAVSEKLKARDFFMITVPFSVYTGWITIATIANITTLLVSWGVSGTDSAAAVWMGIIVIIATLIGIFNAWRWKNWAYLLVFVWAYYGIWLNHTTGGKGFDNQFPGIAGLVGALAILLALGSIALMVRYLLGQAKLADKTSLKSRKVKP